MLITCGAEFNPNFHSYKSDIVVYAVPIGQCTGASVGSAECLRRCLALQLLVGAREAALVVEPERGGDLCHRSCVAIVVGELTTGLFERPESEESHR